ncbi:MAG: helix-turn-helix domain-containing protein [Ruminococcus sp.]|nr:helix-turn-helix domain-containing protein [Ruminococcus sp.]
MKSEERTDYKKCTPEVIYEARKIVIKMWKKGSPINELAEITGFSTNTIYITIRKYKANGMQALKPRKRGIKSGENRTLSPEQEKFIIKMITEKNPDQLWLKCCLWTRNAVQELIKEHYGITMSIVL